MTLNDMIENFGGLVPVAIKSEVGWVKIGLDFEEFCDYLMKQKKAVMYNDDKGYRFYCEAKDHLKYTQ